MVQQVISLNDKKEVAQITADLLAQYFAYELAGVMLVGDNPESPVLGFGGSRGEVVQNELKTGRIYHRRWNYRPCLLYRRKCAGQRYPAG